MPHPLAKVSRLAVLALTLLSACHGGGGSRKDSGGPPTQIDLAVTTLLAVPSTADPEDALTVEGAIENRGTETANPMPGDSFRIRFNLSRDGTFELNEVGFLEAIIADPIPPGGTHAFAFSGSFGNGDTLAIFGNFCNSLSCIPPETGVLGAKVDSGEDIAELNEANNFLFNPMEVVGTRVAATFSGCDFGLLGGPEDPGCNLTVTDGFETVVLHRPCSNCNATDQIFPNELQRFIQATVTLQGCTKNNTPNGTCGGSWRITASTVKPDLPASTLQTEIPCLLVFGQGSTKACTRLVQIRDPLY